MIRLFAVAYNWTPAQVGSLTVGQFYYNLTELIEESKRNRKEDETITEAPLSREELRERMLYAGLMNRPERL